MNNKFNTVTKLFDVITDKQAPSSVNMFNRDGLSTYKKQLYNTQLIKLLSALTDEHEPLKKKSFYLDDEFQYLIKPMTTLDINVQTLENFTQESCFAGNGVDDNDVIDDYITIIGELINGLYGMHDKSLSIDNAQHNPIKNFAFNQLQ